jgi:hypothetical protein
MAHIGNQPFGKTVRTVTTETLASVKTQFYPTGGYTVGYVDAYLNGVRLTETEDFTATNGTLVTLTFNPLIGDTVDIVTYGSVELANAIRRDGDTLVGTLYTRSLIPTSNVTYDIGSSTMRYKDLYLSGNTISLGDINLSTNGTSFSVANSTGGVYPSALGNTTVTGTVTVSSTVNVGANVGITTTGVSIHSSGVTSNSFIANTTGLYSVGLVNATSFTVGSNFIANSSALTTVSNTATIGTAAYFIANGNVGIGTDSTGSTKLFVAHTGTQVSAFNSTAVNGGYMTWQTNGTVIADLGTQINCFGTGGTDTFAINGRGARALLLGTNNTERVRIDSSGRVTLPYQPAFRGTGASALDGAATVVFSGQDSAFAGRNSGFNPATGTFTAPVAGVYVFSWSFLHGNGGSSTYVRVLFKINGSASVSYGDTLADFPLSGGYQTTGMSMAFRLQANDTVSLNNEGRRIYGEQYTSFCGYLIG